MDLFEQVLHALEGTERSPQVWQTADGERTLERRTTGYDRWIESANDGRLAFFSVRNIAARFCDIDGSEERLEL